ncbi:MAG: hypothetical protein V3T05_13510 [Myxococcota bacterium]
MLQRTVASLGLIVLLLAANAHAASGVIEASGEAMIKDGDRVAAKKAAVADGLKNCIDKIVGVTIKSEFTATQQEIVKNNKEEFYSNVKDKLTKESQGFIKTYEVLSEKVDGDVFKVTVKAEVYESKLKAEVARLADLLVGAGNPKIMVLIQVVHVDEEGEAKVIKSSTLPTFIERALMDRGFQLRGTAKAHRAQRGSLDAFDELLENRNRSIKMARAQGADILIGGRVEIRDKGKGGKTGGIDFGDIKRFQIESNLHGIVTASGDIISPNPFNAVEMGMSLNSAVKRMTRGSKGRGYSWFERTFNQLIEDLREALRKMALERNEKGVAGLRSYVITLNGVKSFRKQGRRFMTILQAASGVSGVTQRSFADGTLVVDVSCDCSSVELQDAIFNAADSNALLKNLDAEASTDRQLSFKL